MIETVQGSDQEVDNLIKLIEGNKLDDVTQQLQMSSSNGQQLCNSIGKKGFTPLQCAVFCSHADITAVLLQFGADVNFPLTTTLRKGVDWYEEGSTSLHIACSKRHSDIVEQLLQAGADPNHVNKGAAEQTPLHVAAEYGYLDSVKLLVEKQVDVNCLDQSGETPIHKASRHGHSSVVVYLLTSGADVNTPSNVGHTAVMMAVCEGHLKTTILLLENGSDVTATDADQNGILLLAVQNHKEDLVPLLLDNQANIDCPNIRGDTALHIACQTGQSGVITTLIEGGGNIDLQNHQGQTPLHLSALSNNSDVARHLLTAGARRDITDNDGKLAVDYASNPQLSSMITSGYVSPMPPRREKTIMEIIDEGVEDSEGSIGRETDPDNSVVSTPVRMEQPKSPAITPHAPLTPRSPRGQLNNQALQNRSSNGHRFTGGSLTNQNLENSFKAGSFENGLPVLPPGGAAGQFKKPIGVDRATVETLKNKVVNLEAQILSLGINDDQAVILYRQFGKLNEEIGLARLLVREHNAPNTRPLTPRMENNKGASPSRMDLPSPRLKDSGRKFNPNFMVETVESLKSELQIMRNRIRPTHTFKMNEYIEQVESMALAVVTFAHMMAVTLSL